MPKAAGEVEDVHAGYDGRDVLNGLSLALHAGETFALLGPNGAGKTTLVRVLTGALRPRSGRVSVAGGARTGAVELVPQEIALFPWLTPRENCVAFARLSGRSRRETRARVEPVLKLAGCELDKPVSALSGGYRRRANVAVALMSDPKLLILDEPTVGLDAQGRSQLTSALAGVAESGASLLVVTHDFEFAEAMADRVGVLVDGRLACCGPPRALVMDRFGRHRRVDLVLERPADDDAQSELARLGAAPTAERRVWRLWRELSDFDTRSLAQELSGVRAQIAELRVRPPGLEDLFAAVTDAAA